jgi:hypothetical protein
VIFSGGKKRGVIATEKQEIPLHDIAKIWTAGQRTGQLHIRDIAPLWRKSTLTTKEKSDYLFNDTGVELWFNTHILKAPWFDQAKAHVEICYQLLRMLEAEDPCSSVVNPAGDVESSWDNNTYAMLGRTSLLNHSLHVGEQTIALLVTAEAQHIIPDAMVAALGHDIGKLPSNRPHLYSLGEHPLAAGRVLAEIGPFKRLSRKEDISRAIKHHHSSPEGLLGKTLKKADQKARQRELEEAVEQLQKESKEISTSLKLPEVQKSPATTKEVQDQGILARKADADIYGENNCPIHNTNSSKPERINISTWFDVQQCIAELKPYINRIQNRRFMAFSMPDGYVFFQPKAIEEVIRKLAGAAGAMDIATMDAKDKTMQTVVFSVVDHFRTEHDLIARNLIGDQYFGGYFNITMKSGKVMKGYYTPFKAECFGSIAAMEEDKRQKAILNNFSSVEVYRDS